MATSRKQFQVLSKDEAEAVRQRNEWQILHEFRATADGICVWCEQLEPHPLHGYYPPTGPA